MTLNWYEIKTLDEFKKEYLNAIVYEPYTPQRVGKIIGIKSSTGKFDAYKTFVKVRWLKQTKKYPDKETTVRLAHLNFYKDLIDDHHRKYLKHQKILKEAQKISAARSK